MRTRRATHHIKDFLILGPTLATRNGNRVLEAIHSLYFLPENYKMVFTGAEPVDQSFYSKVVSLVERDALADRVHFTTNAQESDVAILATGKNKPKAKYSVTGDSAEALASAILNIARIAA